MMYAWKAEFDFQHLSLSFPVFVFKTVSLSLKLELAVSARPAGQQVPGFHLLLLLYTLGHRPSPGSLALHADPTVQGWKLMLL